MRILFYLISLALVSVGLTAHALPPIQVERTLTMHSGETLIDTLMRGGFNRTQANQIVVPLQGKISMKKLRAGQVIDVSFPLKENGNDATEITEVKFYTPNDKAVSVSTNPVDNTVLAEVKERKLHTQEAVAVGTINGSLYLSATKAGVPAALVGPFANLFAWELDFTRDIHPGDTFRVVYEKIIDDEGNHVRTGDVLGAELFAEKKRRTAFRFADAHGTVEYYDETGAPKKKLLLRTPLEFTRISSHFNPNRKHPVLGYTRAHRGTDFAAPTGTPVKASGNGTIVEIGVKGGYGNYVRIKHNGTYQTAYAHLHKFARGMKKGSRVKQGQVIAYVGSTGMSSGPHLHYEVLVNNTKVDAMRAKLPAGNSLPKNKLNQFKSMVADYKNQWETLVQLATAEQAALSTLR